MVGMLSGNPFSTLWDLAVPKKYQVEHELYWARPMIQSKIAQLREGKASIPKHVEEKIRTFLSDVYSVDLRNLHFVQSEGVDSIGAWGSLTHNLEAYILVSPRVVEELSHQDVISDENKFRIASTVAHILRDDLVGGEIMLAKQSAKWRLLSFSITALACSPLLYYAPSTLLRLSALSSAISLGSLAATGIDYFYKKHVRYMKEHEHDAFIAGRLSAMQY